MCVWQIHNGYAKMLQTVHFDLGKNIRHWFEKCHDTGPESIMKQAARTMHNVGVRGSDVMIVCSCRVTGLKTRDVRRTLLQIIQGWENLKGEA